MKASLKELVKDSGLYCNRLLNKYSTSIKRIKNSVQEKKYRKYSFQCEILRSRYLTSNFVQVCNNQGHCHCNRGYACPNCSENCGSDGGSVDSGNNCYCPGLYSGQWLMIIGARFGSVSERCFAREFIFFSSKLQSNTSLSGVYIFTSETLPTCYPI